MEGSDQLHALASNIHLLGGRMGPRAGLDVVVKRKIHATLKSRLSQNL